MKTNLTYHIPRNNVVNEMIGFHQRKIDDIRARLNARMTQRASSVLFAKLSVHREMIDFWNATVLSEDE